ncbi:uncharacterized protein LOC124646505 [Lolium rigidum]|uniref:uncharacterized protein LOC124646505 n=1 Tax=Lolium rigidum TaxID=89674 RepID=UPI001F5DDBDC|nr:uncharacterized protein LOC124646505 [Lolium rigidum]
MTLEDDTPGSVAMVTAPGHHLSAGVVEDDHTVPEAGHLLEDEELAYLQLMSDGEARHPWSIWRRTTNTIQASSHKTAGSPARGTVLAVLLTLAGARPREGVAQPTGSSLYFISTTPRPVRLQVLLAVHWLHKSFRFVTSEFGDRRSATANRSIELGIQSRPRPARLILKALLSLSPGVPMLPKKHTSGPVLRKEIKQEERMYSWNFK